MRHLGSRGLAPVLALLVVAALCVVLVVVRVLA